MSIISYLFLSMYKLHKLHNAQIQVSSTSLSSQRYHVYGNTLLPFSLSTCTGHSTTLLSRRETTDGEGLFFFFHLVT